MFIYYEYVISYQYDFIKNKFDINKLYILNYFKEYRGKLVGI